mgnify:CR=1 FL=1
MNALNLMNKGPNVRNLTRNLREKVKNWDKNWNHKQDLWKEITGKEMISQNGRRWRSKETLIVERNDAANKRFEKRLDSSQNARERIEKAVSW